MKNGLFWSYTRTWEQAKVEEKEAAKKKQARTEADKTRKAVKSVQQKVEKATSGDLMPCWNKAKAERGKRRAVMKRRARIIYRFDSKRPAAAWIAFYLPGKGVD